MTGAPLRVATVITRLDGGAGLMALRGAHALDPRHYRVTLVCGGGGLLGSAEAAGFDVVVEPALRAPISPGADLPALHRLTDLFARERFDVVHTHCAKAGAIGRLAASRVGVPRVVHTWHGFPFHAFQSAARRALYVGIERRLGRLTDVALCVGSGVAAEAVRRRLVAAERVRTIGVAVDPLATVRTPDSRARALRALGLAPDSVVVGAVGRLTYQKAPEDFVAALVALRRPGVTGVWIGGGELAGRVRALAEAAAPGARVQFVGHRADVPELLPAFDLFALPSRYEGLPLSIVEAMVCGVPVVATAVNAVPDAVRPGQTGMLVPPGRPGELAAALRHLLDHPDTAGRLAAGARAHVAGRHDAHSLGNALAAAYSGIGWAPIVLQSELTQ